MKRREFLKGLTVGATSMIGLSVLSSCAGGTSSKLATDGTTSGFTTAYLNVSHAHTTLNMTLAQVQAKLPGTYELLTGSHNHTFDLTSADFDTLLAHNSIFKTDLEGHGHQISVTPS